MAEYFISFDTRNVRRPGKEIQAVKVSIELVTIDDLQKKMPINLCEDPMYRELWKYVKANPPR